MYRVVDVELARRRDHILDACLLFQRLVIIDDDLAGLARLIRRPPDADPDFVTGLVVFEMDHPAVVGDLPAVELAFQVFLVNDTDAALEDLIRVQWLIDPDPLTIRMRFDKEAATTREFDLAYDLP